MLVSVVSCYIELNTTWSLDLGSYTLLYTLSSVVNRHTVECSGNVEVGGGIVLE